MPNIKSAKKRVKVTENKTLVNNMKKSALKTSIKKVKQAIEATDKNIDSAFKAAVKLIDKAVSDNLLHKNTAARKKSKLQKELNKADVKKAAPVKAEKAPKAEKVEKTEKAEKTPKAEKATKTTAAKATKTTKTAKKEEK